MLRSVRAAQTAAGAAMAQLAFESVAMEFQQGDCDQVELTASKINLETGSPWTLNDLSLFLFNKERDSLDPDLAANFNPDGATFSNYLAGRKMPEIDRIHLAISRLIACGTLPAEDFGLVHASVGIHRALDPFQSVLLELEHGQRPSKQKAEALAQKLRWLEIGQADFDRLLRKDQTDFRQSQLELVDELFAARAHATGGARQTDAARRKNLRWILRRAESLLSTIERLRVATVAVVPDYNTRALRSCARFGPLMDGAGSLNFGPYVAAWLRAERSEDEIESFNALRQKVLKKYAFDIMPLRGEECSMLPDSARLLEIAMIPDFVDEEFRNHGTRRRDEACLRRSIRWIGAKWTCTAALLRSIEEYYEVAEPHDSDFDEVCCGIDAAAREIANAKPAEVSLVSITRLVKLVRRLSIDVWTSINVDVADAVPLGMQPWRHKDPLALLSVHEGRDELVHIFGLQEHEDLFLGCVTGQIWMARSIVQYIATERAQSIEKVNEALDRRRSRLEAGIGALGMQQALNFLFWREAVERLVVGSMERERLLSLDEPQRLVPVSLSKPVRLPKRPSNPPVPASAAGVRTQPSDRLRRRRTAASLKGAA